MPHYHHQSLNPHQHVHGHTPPIMAPPQHQSNHDGNTFSSNTALPAPFTPQVRHARVRLPRGRGVVVALTLLADGTVMKQATRFTSAAPPAASNMVIAPPTSTYTALPDNFKNAPTSTTVYQVGHTRVLLPLVLLPACLPACLPNLPACLPPCLPVCLPACFPPSLSLCLPACLWLDDLGQMVDGNNDDDDDLFADLDDIIIDQGDVMEH